MKKFYIISVLVLACVSGLYGAQSELELNTKIKSLYNSELQLRKQVHRQMKEWVSLRAENHDLRKKCVEMELEQYRR